MKTNLPEMTNSNPLGEHSKQCPSCQRDFKTDDVRVVYCSQACKNRFAAKKREGLRVRPESHHQADGKYTRTCRHCGTEFRNNSKAAKFCTETCKKAAHSAKYYKRNKKAIKQRVTENRRANRQQNTE